MAYRLANPICGGEIKNQIYNCAIFESSLGVSGIGDVGLLTNIVEDYPIAKNKSSASIAKKQVFKCDIVCCEKESLDKYYSTIKHEKINSFSLNDKTSNLYAENIDYSLDETTVNIVYNDIKTKNGELISGKIEIKTFAPGSHHVLNVLGVVGTALSLNINENKIINGLKNYRGIPGRTNKKNIENITVIEEINPGINTKAIEASINMLPDDSYIISIGGDYGITCEEIDENAVVELINNLDKDILLTGEVGRNILNNVDRKIKFISDPAKVYDFAVENEAITGSDFVKKLLFATWENVESIDTVIEKYSHGWKISRISKVALAVLRLAICEMKYFDDIPVGVSINEAVELCKKYAAKDDSVFVNGILGSASKEEV